MSFKFVMIPPQTAATQAWARLISDSVPGADVRVPENEIQARSDIVDADAAFGTLNSDLLAVANNLRWLQAPAAAPPAGYYFPELIQHSVQITNFREIYNDHISAHILAFVLAFARGLHYYIPHQIKGEWAPRPQDTGVVHLPESTALILGVGGIGAEAARLCSELHMRVVAIDARRDDTPPGVEQMLRPDQLDALLPEADFVIMTIPHTPETEGLMNSARFGLMKDSAFLINIGRGMTVRLDDLVNALHTGQIAGAALDVYEIEPLPEGHALWTAPNVLLTPHSAGFGPYLDDRRADLLVENARRFSQGETLRNVVNKSVWF